MTYEQAKATAAALNAEVERRGALLNTFPRRPDGLTPDHIRALPAYQRAKTEFNFAFAKLRAFNEYFVREHGTERRAERREKMQQTAKYRVDISC